MTRASNIARTGNLTKAQSIMKGFKRGMRKNISTQEHQEVYQGLEKQIGTVYSKMGDSIRQLSTSE